MQHLVCRVGSTLHLGDDIRVVVHARLGERVTFGVVAPRHRELRLDGVALRPAPDPGGGCWYLFSLLNVRAFLVGGIEVRLAARKGRPDAGHDHDHDHGHVHLDVVGAESIRVHEGEARALDDGPGRQRPAAVGWQARLRDLLGTLRTA